MTTPVDFDTATPGVLDVKLPGEDCFVVADFSARIPSDWTISAVASTISVIDGPGDAGATAMLDGAAAITGLQSSQRVIDGIGGNDYLLTFTATATSGAATQSASVQMILPVRDTRLG